MVEQVLYDVKGILEKNRDTFRDDILNLLKDSRQDVHIKKKKSFLRTSSITRVM